MPVIYVYKAPEGHIKADLKQMDNTKLLRTITINNKHVAKKIIRRPGKLIPDRITALAERLLEEVPGQMSFWDRVKRGWRAFREC